MWMCCLLLPALSTLTAAAHASAHVHRFRGFLADARIPMRLAANTPSGFPVVLSLWFEAEGDELLAAVHRDARIAFSEGAGWWEYGFYVGPAALALLLVGVAAARNA